MCPLKPNRGFTLAELLIALIILGLIATFTIPKVISSQQNGTNNAKAKETLSMIAAAYNSYQLNNTVSSSFAAPQITQYMNYASTSTTAPMDDLYTLGEYDCSATYPCLRLHNGGLLRYSTGDLLGGTNTTNAVWFVFDPDGSYSGTTNGTGKAIMFFLYANGRVTTIGNITTNTCTSGMCFTPQPSQDPPWFSW